MKKDKYLFIHIIILILCTISAYMAGMVTNIESKRPSVEVISREQNTAMVSDAIESIASTSLGNPVDPMVVGSKTGDKYHFPWCSGALRMKETSKIFFKNSDEARKAGYTPAANCKGLQ